MSVIVKYNHEQCRHGIHIISYVLPQTENQAAYIYPDRFTEALRNLDSPLQDLEDTAQKLGSVCPPRANRKKMPPKNWAAFIRPGRIEKRCHPKIGRRLSAPGE